MSREGERLETELVRYGASVAAAEKDAIGGFLDHYRSLVVNLCNDLPKEDLTRSTVPSGTSILGLVKHLTLVERTWFAERFKNEPSDWEFDPADPDADFRIEDDESVDEIIGLYRRGCDRSRQIYEDASLDDFAAHPKYTGYNLRWIALHMLEEIARHVGHADIIREQIDGRVGEGYDYG